ncbi:para-nitrobenzyl esterase-like [Pieris napi]|uniref:para-nitrobenzyl esterase-like n=1 Tax=Pieris napi TaxID=78633 RepID=UPI001FBB489E|nr:para-nitrobenzyl esterase-like [Pieris napi]
MWSCVFIFFACICICYADSRVIDTAQGPVKGYKENGLYAFYNIPYAKAPTGRDRFKPPLPAPARTYVLEARDRGILCPQPTMLIDMFPQSVTMTEDCLVANVYIPDTTKMNLPVVVYVHGGGYIVGYGNLFTYKHFVKTHEVIVVTFNYRLGAHGFLCLGTDAVPGNAGMKDQVALLRWVKENIANFGGDPDDVTIAG